MSKHILALDDELAIREMIAYALVRQNYRVSMAANATEARSVIGADPIDLALVDWMLPGPSGLEFIRQLRSDELTKRIPVIMLTAKAEEDDVATGLDTGADDYICKPFSPKELNARIKALLRRSDDFIENNLLRRGQLMLDDSLLEVIADGDKVMVGHTEYKLLRFLMNNSERVHGRSHLLDHVWGADTYLEERTIDVHILRLRKALKPSGLDWMIQTSRGAGYRLSTKVPA